MDALTGLATKPMHSESLACPVCFQDVARADTVTLTACSHVCCRACLRQHVTTKIASGQLTPRCFHTVTNVDGGSRLCTGEVSQPEIEHLVDPKTLEKYRRFQFNAQHPVLGRQCPHCEYSQVCMEGEAQPACTCQACGKAFCFTHGSAHVGRSCHEYEDETKQTEQITTAVLKRTTKRCPDCCVTIEKNGGCNHMTCLKCGASFCWLCLTLVEQSSSPDHFQSWSTSSCAGLQSADLNEISSLQRFGRLAVRGLLGVVVAVPAIAVTLALTVITVGWYPIRHAYGGTAWGATKVCFFFTAMSIYHSLEQAGNGLTQWLRDAMIRPFMQF